MNQQSTGGLTTMKQRRTRRGLRVILAGGVGALAFAALTSVGAAVSPAGTPAASDQYPKKVTICHHTHSKKNPFVTIRVSRNALKAHFKHGDTIGPCSAAKFTLCVKGKTTKVKGEKKAEKLLRKQAKLGKCKVKSKGKSEKQKAKSAEKQKGKSEENKQKGKTKDKGKPADPGKPADTPGNGGDKGKKN
jgi:hypothetical protein